MAGRKTCLVLSAWKNMKLSMMKIAMINDFQDTNISCLVDERRYPGFRTLEESFKPVILAGC